MENREGNNQSSTSRFTTVPGLLILLFFAVVAIYFKARIVGAFLCFFFLICLASRFWSRGSLGRIRLWAEPVISSCHVGGNLKIRLKVRNLSFLPLVWLDVILPLGPKELMRPLDDDFTFRFLMPNSEIPVTGIRERFVWILWQQEISWEETLMTLNRGACTITEANLQAGDGFGLSAQAKRIALPVPISLLVYPRLYTVNVNPFLRYSEEAASRNRGQQEDVTILKGSRPYQPGDSVKRINWRFLAASGRMEIKQFETVLPGCAAFILDLYSFHRMVKIENSTSVSGDLVPEFVPEALETMISFIASSVRGLSENGVASALFIPAYAGHEAVVLMPDAEDEDDGRLMEALARIDFEGRKNREDTRRILFPWDEFWDVSHSLSDIYICSMSEDQEQYGELIETFGEGKAHRVLLARRQANDGGAGFFYVEDLMPEAFHRPAADRLAERGA